METELGAKEGHSIFLARSSANRGSRKHPQQPDDLRVLWPLVPPISENSSLAATVNTLKGAIFNAKIEQNSLQNRANHSQNSSTCIDTMAEFDASRLTTV